MIYSEALLLAHNECVVSVWLCTTGNSGCRSQSPRLSCIMAFVPFSLRLVKLITASFININTFHILLLPFVILVLSYKYNTKVIQETKSGQHKFKLVDLTVEAWVSMKHMFQQPGRL